MTKKERELLVQIEAYLPELKAEIDVAKKDLSGARSLSTAITTFHDRSSALLTRLEDNGIGVNAKLAAGAETLDKITAASSSAQTHLASIEDTVRRVQDSMATMEAIYAAFQTLKENIEDPSSGMTVTLAAAQTAKAQAESASSSAAKLLQGIATDLDNIQTSIVAMDTAYAEFQTVKAKIDDKTTGLDATLTTAQATLADIAAVSKNAESVFAEISRYKDQAAKNASSIQTIKDESDTTLATIRQHEADSEKTRDKIADIYQLVSQTGHANRFDGKAKDLTRSSWIWFAAGVAAAIGAILVAHYWIAPLFPRDTSKGITSAMTTLLVLRSLTVSPLIILAVIAFRHFASDRRQADQYAFKAVSAATLEGSIYLVKDAVNGVADQKLADFAILTITKLHTEPQELQKVTRLSFNFGNKLANMGAQITDTLGSIDQGVKKVADQATQSDK
ncbi:MAG TPA: hypothetical protein VMR45_01490 [Patescibacteria group bacterium]|nr:hypothetical protein [Patescibacteria group bacterium]